MTLRQKSWYVTRNLLINAHFIILWPPGCSSQGGFDPFLRLKKIKSASHLNISVQNLSCTFFFFLHWRDYAAAQAIWTVGAVRWGRIYRKVRRSKSSLAKREVSNIDLMKSGKRVCGCWLRSSRHCFASRFKKLAVSMQGVSLQVAYCCWWVAKCNMQ